MKKICIIICLLFLVSCSHEEDPIQIARHNMLDEFDRGVYSQVSLINQIECSPYFGLLDPTNSYMECRVQIKGYVNWEIYYCSTKKDGGCSRTMPKF